MGTKTTPKHWYCTQCGALFTTTTVPNHKTTKCHGCNRVLNITQLFYGGIQLIHAGLGMITRCVSILSDRLDSDYSCDDLVAVATINTFSQVINVVTSKLKLSGADDHLMLEYSDYVRDKWVDSKPRKKLDSKKLRIRTRPRLKRRGKK